MLLEYLQAAFYAEALERARLQGELREFAEVVAEHERAHVALLRKSLGADAQAQPKFDFGETTRSARAFGPRARLLEDSGVAAYNGQAANLTRPALAAAASIVSVEGRHAAWIRDILRLAPAPHPADAGAPAASVVADLRRMRLLARGG